MPGPAVEGPVASRPRPTPPGSEPLWELGVGVAGFRFDDYRGSDHTNTYVLPLPFFAYRGPFLRADRDGARAILFAGRRVTVDVSLGASVPTKSKDDAARQRHAGPGRRPSRSARASSSSSGSRADRQAQARPAHAGARGDHARAVAARDRPHLLAQSEPRHRRPRRQREPGPARRPAVRATSRYHQYFYSVAPEFATADAAGVRRRPGGYAGWRATAAFSRRFGNAWLGAFRPLRRPARRGVCARARWCARKPQSLRASASHGSSRLRASAYGPTTERRRRRQAPALRHRFLFALRHRPARARCRSSGRCSRRCSRSLLPRALAGRLGRGGDLVHLSLLLGQRRAARPDATSIRARSTPARRARRADRRRQPSDHARRAAASSRGCRAASAS